MFQRFSQWPWLTGILFVAFGLRAGAAILVQQRVDQTGSLCLIAGDAEGYWLLARALARGQDFSLYDPPRYIERMPGFPLLLAAHLKVFGTQVLLVRLMLAAVGTFACGLVYWLGRELANRTTGLIASGLAAVSPTFVVFSVLLLSETLFATSLLASLIALTWVTRTLRSDPGQGGLLRETRLGGLTSPKASIGSRHSSGSPQTLRTSALLAALAGAACGLATLVRPTWILAAPGFGLLYLCAGPVTLRSLIRVGCLCAGLLLALAPWIVRNYRVSGHLVATTLWLGPSLYDGLSPLATGDSNMEFVEREGRYARRDSPDFEYQANVYYRRAALDFARRNPARAVELGCYKLWRFLNPFPNAAQFSQPFVWWGVGLFETPVLLLAAIGAWVSRRAIWVLLVTAGPCLYFALVHTVFVGSARYRLPAEYALLVLTAIGIQWVLTRPGGRTA